jgi:dCMP deaminase
VKSQQKFQNQTEADHFFLTLADQERASTDDPKGKLVKSSAVGALVLGSDQRTVASANVLPPRLRHVFNERVLITEADRYHVIEHAERAVLFRAFANGIQVEGGTIYCTRFPCSDCARAIVWAGISRAVFANGFTGEHRWLESQRAALRILRDGGVIVRILTTGS